jgi:feruloyl esterase
MKILSWLTLAGIAALVAVPVVLSQAQESPKCAALAHLNLPHVTVTDAAMVAASGNHPAYCRIAGASHPTADSDIRFEVWIPDGWNGRYLQVGNGGFAGAIPQAGLMMGIAQGYAVAGTDDGHQAAGSDASWALGHPEKQIDFGYRALKETTDAAKRIITAYAGAPRYSYFQGCSDGGREALMEAQRFPDDFDGIVAGDPANYWSHLETAVAWDYQALTAMPGSWIPPAKLKLIQAEAARQCGDEDGVIQDPEGCKFRPAKIRCKSGDAADCLTDAQITALNAIYAGPRNPRTGAKLFSGFSPGGEDGPQGWTRWVTGTSPGDTKTAAYAIGSNFFRYLVHADPNYDIAKMNFDSDVALADERGGRIINSRSPDLSAFKARGGKLIQYHGWADPAIPALDSVDYYKSVQARMGDTRAFYRLFMAPGMLHCARGEGPNVLATLPAIRAWVEEDKAPDHILASKYQDDDPTKPVERSRPLCVFPARAAWDGTGDKTKAESFRCRAS